MTTELQVTKRLQMLAMKKQDQKFLSPGQQKAQEPIIVVSGLPRSGTSMMMRMLQAGGLEVLTDNLREADEDNPKGYFEFERVKQLDKGDLEWLPKARGKVVKVISALLEHLLAQYNYRVLFMHRHMKEILASQQKMLLHRGESPKKTSDERMAELFQRHLRKVSSWLAEQENTVVLDVSYNEALADPLHHSERINQFLGNRLDVNAMIAAVDATLYRNRSRATDQQ